MAFSFNFDIKAKQDEYCKDDTNAEKDHEYRLKTVKDDTPSLPKPLKAAREHPFPGDVAALLRDVVTETVCVGALPRLACVNESVLELTVEERREEEEEEEEVLRKVASQRSDLLPGVYEGGLRVWECTYDLLTHMERGGVAFSGRRVLDLGCGAGLLGVMAMRLGAEHVDFQDYNSTVIRHLTIANAALNQQGGVEGEEEEEEGERKKEGERDEEEEREREKKEGERGIQKRKEGEREKEKKEGEREGEHRVGQKRGKGDQRAKQTEEEERRMEGGGGRSESPPPKRRPRPDSASAPAPLTGAPCCRFFSGDWTSFLSLLQQGGMAAHKYDIILTSETIYNTAYYLALHEVLHRLLADDGQVLLATKAHYFGVGGGLLLFERFLEERGVFETRRLFDVEEGLQRHVLSLTFRRRNTHTPNGTARKAT